MKRPMFVSAVATLGACVAMAAHGQSAVAVLDSTAGTSAKGTIGFDQRGDKVFVDDYTTQPTGNSGARVACGVIHKR